MSDKWGRHPEGPIVATTAQLAHLPLWLLGQRTPWHDDLDQYGPWRLTVKCEWTGTAAEFEEYRSRQDHPAGKQRLKEAA
jgi:hypothetical protein